MNYMAAYDAPSLEPECLPDRRLYFNYDAKRAGRAIADLQVESLQYIMVLRPVKLLGMTCDVTFGGGPAQRLFGGWERFGVRERDEMVALDSADTVVIESPVIEDGESEDLVQWFAEHQAAAERAIETGPSPRDDVDYGEVVLARRGGIRSRSWRGAGTMRRR